MNGRNVSWNPVSWDGVGAMGIVAAAFLGHVALGIMTHSGISRKEPWRPLP